MINFFTSPIGLGHATRDIAIAEKLQAEIEFVSGEGAASLIARKGYKAMDVYRPGKFVVESGQLQHSFKWLMDPFTVMPIQMFNWVSRPQQEFQINAAAAGVVLMVMTLIMNGVAIYIRYRFRKKIKW